MKKILLIGGLSIAGVFAVAQTCSEIIQVCNDQLEEDTEHLFVSDGQVYTSFLSLGETAEFETTFYGGSLYRLSTSAGSDDNHVKLSIRDRQNNELFSNVDHGNAPYWDFKVENTITCTIALELDANTKASGSGCVNLLIAFKK